MPPASVTRGAVLLGRTPDERILDDVEQLKWMEARGWKSGLRDLREARIPEAANQGFRSIPLVPGGPNPPTVNQTTVTGGTTIALLWDAPNITPIAANYCRGGEVFKVTAWGVQTQAVTAVQTATFTPIWGTTTGGTSLGASVAAPLEAKVFTNTPWVMALWVHIRQAGSSGLATANGFIEALPFVGIAGGTVEGGTVPFGTASTTATTINTTVASGLLVAITPSLATQSWTTLSVVPESLN